MVFGAFRLARSGRGAELTHSVGTIAKMKNKAAVVTGLIVSDPGGKVYLPETTGYKD